MGGEIVLGPLRTGDVPRCVELEEMLFSGDDPWRAEAFLAELAAGHHYLAARSPDGTVIGFAGLAVLAAPPRAEAEVHTIGVEPARQGRGIGRALLRALLRRADDLGATTYLEVRTDNVPALTLYRDEGFEVVGTRRRYYRSGADAFTMRRAAVRTATAGRPVVRS